MKNTTKEQSYLKSWFVLGYIYRGLELLRMYKVESNMTGTNCNLFTHK